MAEYFLDIEYKSITYGEEEVNFKEFECCTFTKCNSQCAFVAVTLLIVPLMIVLLAMPKLIM
jgi:hypothetical protein